MDDGEARVPAFDRLGPPTADTPLVCAVPHAGRHYPPQLLRHSAVPLGALEELEDRHADLLVAQAVAEGAVAIVACAARAWIDLNRGEEDLDPASRFPTVGGAPASARARSGLGLIPRRIGRRDLWRAPPTPESAAARIAEVHAPYHAAIAAALADARDRHGYAVLLDCHSMPAIGQQGAARIVLGDRHGTTSSPEVIAALAAAARHAGYRVACNAPYAGAHTVARHGRPDDAFHAVQVEIDRSLYLARDSRTVSAHLAAAQALIALLGRIAIAAAAPPLALAAE